MNFYKKITACVCKNVAIRMVVTAFFFKQQNVRNNLNVQQRDKYIKRNTIYGKNFVTELQFWQRSE